ncbi:unnamed protein product [Penicillium egyptiacum]|uniref:C2H2-type domain-containing protein n=1 Tax=Penicillium egyptiacum TaxID=1303716 RepID=A0A9W4P6D9_9EURO|nr:unnamed protein product [Penicillium egyptiacum]
MFREHGKHPLLLSPAQPSPELDVQHDSPNLSKTKPPTLATTPFHHWDSHALLSWPDPGHSIWRPDNFDTMSPQREYWVESHRALQVYHYSTGSYHTSMPLKDNSIPNIHCSQAVDHHLESGSILYLPPLRLCQLRRLDLAPTFNVAEGMPGADFSTMQTINPTLVFPHASTNTSESLNFAASLGAAAEVYSIPSCTGISSTWFLDQPQEPSQEIHDTTVCINDHSLLDYHVYSKKPGHNLDVEDQEFDMHKRQFKCKVIGCGIGFKRQDHLERHTRSHLKEKPHVCWVPGCHRAFSRRDNLKAHCTKTHSRRGGRNRYVATLDETSPDYDPGFRGQLSFDGRPLRFLAPINLVPKAKPQQP